MKYYQYVSQIEYLQRSINSNNKEIESLLKENSNILKKMIKLKTIQIKKTLKTNK